MRVVIAGGSGFLGRALTRRLVADGHEVTVLTRGAWRGDGGTAAVPWSPDGTVGEWGRVIDGAHAVVNLAGAGIADRRWSPSRKALLVASRVGATTSLVAAMARAGAAPTVFLSGSGVGYYGATDDTRIAEDAPVGVDFVAQMARRWEEAAAPAATTSRVVLARTGLVLGDDGALAKMLPPFKLGVGGRLGSGRQWMPWIHIDDWVGLAVHVMQDARAFGPINFTAPEPASNRDFTFALGRVLRRPTIFPVPAPVLRLALGEMADLLLTGQRAVPARALELGYRFRHTDLTAALAAVLSEPKAGPAQNGV